MILLNRFRLNALCILFLSSTIFSSTGFSQDATCDIQIIAYDVISNKKLSGFSVRFLSISDDSYEWKTVVDDVFSINDLTQTEYNLGVRYDNYRASSFDLALDCSKASQNGTMVISIPLWKNNNFDSSIYVKLDEKSKNIVRYFPKYSLSGGLINITANIGFESQMFVTIDGGVLNQKALKLVRPKLSTTMLENHPDKTLEVEVLIGFDGSVEVAEALKDNSRVEKLAVEAAMKSKFRPTTYDGKPAKVFGNNYLYT